MPLTRLLAQHVSNPTRSEGQSYYARGRVQIEEADDWEVRAYVQGSDTYSVALAREDKAVLGACSCPRYTDTLKPCKHIWATLLAAEHKNYLGGTGRGEPVRFEHDEDCLLNWIEEREDGGWDDDDPMDEYEEFHQRPQPAPVPARHTSQTKAPDGMEKAVAQLRTTMESPATNHWNSWPPGRELVYVVDASKPQIGDHLSLEVMYRQRKQNGEWSKPKGQRISHTQITQLPDIQDREIVSMLVGAKEQVYGGVSYGYSYYDSAPVRYQLTPPVALALMPRLCATGRCWLRTTTVGDVQPHTLSWEGGEPWEFWLEVARTRPVNSTRSAVPCDAMAKACPWQNLSCLFRVAWFSGTTRSPVSRISPHFRGSPCFIVRQP